MVQLDQLWMWSDGKPHQPVSNTNGVGRSERVNKICAVDIPMNTNTINAQKMLSFLNRPEPVVQAPRKKAPAKKAPIVEDYPYETESSDSEVEVIEKPKKKKVVAAKKEVVAVALPQPAPPAAMASLASSPMVDAPKEKKVRAKKEKVESVAEVAQGGSTGDSNLSAKTEPEKKKKRAQSAYNKFASEKMKAGMSMKDVAAAWKAEKEKAAK